jgi:uncharacterized protein YkwD
MQRTLAILAVALVGLGVTADEPPSPATTEKEVVALTNAERKKNDLPVLRANPLLAKVARAHSENMAKQGKMEHELDGKTPFDRIKGVGYKYFWAGENIAYGDDNITPQTILSGWMDSKPHRANILHEKYSEIGVGVARDDKGRVYYTQVFGKPRP